MNKIRIIKNDEKQSEISFDSDSDTGIPGLTDGLLFGQGEVNVYVHKDKET